MLKTRPIKCASARLHRHKNLRRFAMARPSLVAMRAWVIHRLLRLLSILPLPINHALGTLVGLFMYVLPTRIRHVTEANLAARYPARNSHRRRRVARVSLIETGKSLAEAPYLWRVSNARISALVKRASTVRD